KRFLAIAVFLTAISGSCSKEGNLMEEYVGLFEDEYIASVPVDTENVSRGKAMVDSIARQIFVENEIQSERELTIYHFGGSSFGFFATFMTQEAKRLENDPRIKEISKNFEVTTGN